jgi:ubiquinone/menaquinone biosynthesis C-methylase UbiE
MTNVEFRQGLAEELPVGTGWADVVISNGVINLCADKRAVFSELYRVLRRGGIFNSRTSQMASRCPFLPRRESQLPMLQQRGERG